MTRTRTAVVFFFNDTATTEIYTLSLHDALPICQTASAKSKTGRSKANAKPRAASVSGRSEEHTSELQSQFHLVCRLLLEKKNSSSATRHRPRKRPRFRPFTP